MIYCLAKTAPTAIKEIKKVGFKKWFWFVFVLNRNEQSTKLRLPEAFNVSGVRKSMINCYCSIKGIDAYEYIQNVYKCKLEQIYVKRALAHEIDVSLSK